MLRDVLPDTDERTTRYYYGGKPEWQLCEEQIIDSMYPYCIRSIATYVYGRYIDEVLQMQ